MGSLRTLLLNVLVYERLYVLTAVVSSNTLLLVASLLPAFQILLTKLRSHATSQGGRFILLAMLDSTENNMTAKTLDLTARSLDLASTLAGPVLRPAIQWTAELYQWIGREGLGRANFEYTISLAMDMLQPNNAGLEIVRDLDVISNRLMGLNLVTPGNLGRNVMSNPNLRWMATTGATILEAHSFDFVSEFFTELLFIGGKHPSKHSAQLREVYAARVYPVIDKMVDSIALHSVNIRNGLTELPNGLRELPRHYMSPRELAKQ